MRLLLASFALAILLSATAHAERKTAIFVADGFDFPVGKPNADGYYKARGYTAHGHLGEDWNGRGGGDTDLGHPVYSIAHGIVLFAKNYYHGWGNCVIVRHAYQEAGQTKYVDSLYAHLDQINVRYGQHVKRGQLVGTIGTGGGLYPAHLHFELRKDIRVGMARQAFPKDDSVYWSGTHFINDRRRLATASATVMAPIDTFSAATGKGIMDDPAEPAGFTIPSIRPKTTPPPGAPLPGRYDDLRKALERKRR
jgi:murein DD-endopeptidase MepM/ murein hydrolase activator NlpD